MVCFEQGSVKLTLSWRKTIWSDALGVTLKAEGCYPGKNFYSDSPHYDYTVCLYVLSEDVQPRELPSL
jgi:hypothetical protein